MDVSTPEGLAHHAETLSDYLYEYGKYPVKRGDNSYNFYKYLISACWGKLYQRFCSWQALGFIRKFEERVGLLEGHIKEIGSPNGPNLTFKNRGPGNRSLVQLLYLNKTSFQKMLPSVLPDEILSSLPQSQSNLFVDLWDAVESDYKAIEKQGDCTLKKLYTEKTMQDFHYFVYCAFLLACQAMREINDRHAFINVWPSKANKTAEYESSVVTFKNSILAAVLPLKLLQSVLSSMVFKRHIAVWTNDGESLDELLPKWSEKEDNLKFRKVRNILLKTRKGPSKAAPTEGGDEDGDKPKERPTDYDEEDGVESDDVPEVCGNPFVVASLTLMMPHCSYRVLQGFHRSLHGLGHLWPTFLASKIWNSTVLDLPLSISTIDPTLKFSL